MKLWIDATNPAPESYAWCRNFEQARILIQTLDNIRNLENFAYNDCSIDFIDFDFYLEGKLEFVNWLKETNHNYQLRAHINDPFRKE